MLGSYDMDACWRFWYYNQVIFKNIYNTIVANIFTLQ